MWHRYGKRIEEKHPGLDIATNTDGTNAPYAENMEATTVKKDDSIKF